MLPKYSNLEFLKDLWKIVRVYKKSLLFFSFTLILANALGLIPAILIANMIDTLSLSEIDVYRFYWLLILLILVMVVSNIIRHLSKYFLGLNSFKLQKYTKVKSFEKLMQGSLFWHDQENTGSKMQKILDGERSIEKFKNLYTNQIIPILVNFIGVIAIFSFFGIKYAFIAFLLIITYIYFEIKLNKAVAQKAHEVQLKKEESSGKAYEVSSNIMTVKSLGIENKSNLELSDLEENIFLAKKERQKANIKKWASVQFINVIFLGIFLFFVGRDVIIGAMSVGMIIVYVDYVKRLQRDLNTISNSSSTLIEVKYGLYRLMTIFKSVPEIKEGNKTLNNWEELKAENISFSYKDKAVLKNLSFELKKNEKVAFVSSSGGGKSTIFKILLKLYVQDSGTIYFDNLKIEDIKTSTLLKKISVAPQEIELFNSSFKNNIVVNSTSFNESLYKKVIKISELESVVKNLKNKDDTFIGEKGVRLSGGQKQRIGIARALYKNSDIIIFDECTSNLDYKTERKIIKNIKKYLKGKTLIMAAHRLNTLKDVDTIFFLDKGSIVEQGSYAELVKLKGKFYKMLKK